MRWLTLCLLCAAAVGCGNICNVVVNAEQDANSKGSQCSNSKVTVHDASKCSANLNECSPDDVSEMQLYAQCFENLSVCTPDTQTSWNLSALGCELQPAGKLSAACAAGFVAQ
jgi:hypothetical protein